MKQAFEIIDDLLKPVDESHDYFQKKKTIVTRIGHAEWYFKRG